MRLLGLAAGAAVALALSAEAQEAPPFTVSAIHVEADVTAITSREAAAYWQALGADLETAIAAEMVAWLDPEGKAIVVDIDEITLANALAVGLGPEDARLAGRVTVLDPASERVEATYDITASASQAAGFLATDQEVVTLSPTSDEFYRAVVSAFARGVAETLRGGT